MRDIALARSVSPIVLATVIAQHLSEGELKDLGYGTAHGAATSLGFCTCETCAQLWNEVWPEVRTLLDDPNDKEDWQ